MPQDARPHQLIPLWPELPPYQEHLRTCENCGKTGSEPGVMLAWEVAPYGHSGAIKFFDDRKLTGRLVTQPCPVCAGSAHQAFLRDNCGLDGMVLGALDALEVHAGLLTLSPAQDRARALVLQALEDITAAHKARRIRSLFFAGPPGVGKTMALVSIVNGARLAGLHARYLMGEHMLAELRRTYSGSSGLATEDVMLSLSRLPVLALDEFDRANFESGWVRTVYFGILNQRLESRVLTVFASNRDLEALAASPDPLPSLASRLSSGLVCAMDGEDLRPLVGAGTQG